MKKSNYLFFFLFVQTKTRIGSDHFQTPDLDPNPTYPGSVIWQVPWYILNGTLKIGPVSII